MEPGHGLTERQIESMTQFRFCHGRVAYPRLLLEEPHPLTVPGAGLGSWAMTGTACSSLKHTRMTAGWMLWRASLESTRI